MAIQAQAVPSPSKKSISFPIGKFRSYLKDASNFKGKAKRIFFPTDESQISSLLKEANKTGIPLTVSGAGTGLTGARVPLGGHILSVERMDKILKIQWNRARKEGYAIVQPGVRLSDLEKALQKKGLFYPPNPGQKSATIGGTVSTNASGSRSFRYGATRRWVESLRVILPNGDRLNLTRGRIKEHQNHFTIALANGRRLTFSIPTHQRKLHKSCAGYYARPGMDLADLFIGSEGTLGVFTQVTLRILKQPEGLLSGFLFFKSEKESFRFSKKARQLHPRALEFFDSKSLQLLSHKHPNIPASARAALFFEEEIAPQQADRAQKRWMRCLHSSKAKLPAWFSLKPEGEEYFRQVRYDLPVMVNERVKYHGFRKVGTDMAVPPRASEKMFDFYLQTLQRSRIPYVLFGHLGDHHLHANLLARTQKEFEHSQKIYRILAKKAIALGGTISAEHGIGKIRITYLKMMVGEKGLGQMARIKCALDPNGILNPGNIVPIP